MKVRKIVVDTDIIADHLTTTQTVSLLRILMRQYFCYTTVFNAAELFAAARTAQERRAVEHAMQAMKVLGLNGKSAKNIARLLNHSRTTMAGLIAGVCVESRLPVATLHPERFTGMKQVNIVTLTTGKFHSTI